MRCPTCGAPVDHRSDFCRYCGTMVSNTLASQAQVGQAMATGGQRTQQDLVNRAWAMLEQGRYAEAEAIYGDVLTARQQVLGEDHPEVLQVRQALAQAMYRQGRHAEAEVAYRGVLGPLWRVLGEDHPYTLKARFSLAQVLRTQMRFPEAEAIYREVFQAQQRVLGKGHPETLLCGDDLAGEVIRQRRYTETEAIYRELFEARRQTLGEHHHDTLRTRRNMAVAAGCQGPRATREALNALTTVWRAQQQSFGKNHPETRKTKDTIYWLKHFAWGNVDSPYNHYPPRFEHE